MCHMALFLGRYEQTPTQPRLRTNDRLKDSKDEVWESMSFIWVTYRSMGEIIYRNRDDSKTAESPKVYLSIRDHPKSLQHSLQAVQQVGESFIQKVLLVSATPR